MNKKNFVVFGILLFAFCFLPLVTHAQTRPPTTLERLAAERRERASAYITRIVRSLSALVDYDEVLLARIDLAIHDREKKGDDTYRPAAFAMSAHDELAEGSSLLASSTPAEPLTDESLLAAKTALVRAQDRLQTAHEHIGDSINALEESVSNSNIKNQTAK